MFLMSITLFLDFSLIPAKYRLFQDEKNAISAAKVIKKTVDKRERGEFLLDKFRFIPEPIRDMKCFHFE